MRCEPKYESEGPSSKYASELFAKHMPAFARASEGAGAAAGTGVGATPGADNGQRPHDARHLRRMACDLLHVCGLARFTHHSAPCASTHAAEEVFLLFFFLFAAAFTPLTTSEGSVEKASSEGLVEKASSEGSVEKASSVSTRVLVLNAAPCMLGPRAIAMANPYPERWCILKSFTHQERVLKSETRTGKRADKRVQSACNNNRESKRTYHGV